jgi:uncharacterized membrane protein required for colicin V production
MNWVDVIIIAILAATIIRGYSDGFVLSVLGVTGILAAIVAARMYFRRLSEYLISNTLLYNKLYNVLLQSMERRGTPSRGLAPTIEVPEVLQGFDIFSSAMEAGTEAVAAGIATAVSTIIVYLLSILAIYIGVRFVFTVVISLLNSLFELPVLKQFNKLGGIVAGFVKGVLGLMILATVMVPITAILSRGWLTEAIDQSVLAGYLFRYNLVLPWALDMIAKVLTG